MLLENRGIKFKAAPNSKRTGTFRVPVLLRFVALQHSFIIPRKKNNIFSLNHILRSTKWYKALSLLRIYALKKHLLPDQRYFFCADTFLTKQISSNKISIFFMVLVFGFLILQRLDLLQNKKRDDRK